MTYFLSSDLFTNPHKDGGVNNQLVYLNRFNYYMDDFKA